MLSDRSYMRDEAHGGRTSVLTWLLCAIAACFILQNCVTHLLTNRLEYVEAWAGLTVPQVFHAAQPGWSIALWVVHLFTYGFIHPQANLLNLLFIGLSLYFLGRDLLPILGSKAFLGLYFATLIAGGIFWTAAHWRHPAMLMGAAPAVAGLLAVYALLFPDQEITLLILFIPVTVKPKYVALTVLAADIFLCVFYELLGSEPPFALNPSAHLGGMAAGWVYWKFFHDGGWRSARPAIELPKWIKRSPPASVPAAPLPVNAGSRENLRAEVDRILDKINSQGFGALTADEKRLLDEAKDSLSRR
ncbi:MAG TPA: rhomboid family intramembrane serine protease [Opitutaceae bacterium]|nr:rhomboid family intramembrane serine protease [Opitutaceae bacterium]